MSYTTWGHKKLDTTEQLCTRASSFKFLSYIFGACITFFFWLYLKACKEKAMAAHSSTLAWKIPWMEEPGKLRAVHGVAKSQT